MVSKVIVFRGALRGAVRAPAYGTFLKEIVALNSQVVIIDAGAVPISDNYKERIESNLGPLEWGTQWTLTHGSGIETADPESSVIAIDPYRSSASGAITFGGGPTREMHARLQLAQALYGVPRSYETNITHTIIPHTVLRSGDVGAAMFSHKTIVLPEARFGDIFDDTGFGTIVHKPSRRRADIASARHLFARVLLDFI